MASDAKQKKCFLVDFDGTLCESDLGDLLIHHASGQEWWWHDSVKSMGDLDPEVVRNNYKAWEQVEISESDFRKLVDQHARPRKGFERWHQRVFDEGHEIYVVSAGLRSYVAWCVDAWTKGRIGVDRVIAVDVLKDGVYAHVRPDVDRILRNPSQSGYAKGHVARSFRQQFPDHLFIAVGDGRSDIRLAENCDRIYARRYLAELLKSQQKTFHFFESFDEIEI